MNFNFTSTKGAAFDELLPSDIRNKQNIISLGVTNEEGVPIGAIAASLVNYSYEIIWLYVRDEERRKGVASKLLREFLSVIRNTNQIYPVRIKYDSEARDICGFMDSMDYFRRSCIGKRFVIDSDRRRNSDTVSLLLKHGPKKTERFFEQSEHMRDNLYRRLREQEIDLKELVLECGDTFINDLCLCHKGYRIDALILVKELSQQEIDIVFAYAQNKVYFANVLIEVLRSIHENYPDMTLSITTLNTKSELCVRHLFGNDINCEYLFRDEWNYLLD